ncbi:MAG: prepilin-type N-terminal cleavage/methylation domain-containing protein [Pirellulales bacterium]|nr:prepilin-type N-terminal cleavage/methylation domain-containing protein [Planctomycetales bacterium]
MTNRWRPTCHAPASRSDESSHTGKWAARGRRRGYTLLELMLVLAILLVMASLAWPRVEGVYERHRLRKAAEDVRVHLTGSRLRALEEGTVYQFRFQPDGRSYDVAPLATGATAVLSGTLPESMHFAVDDAQTAGTSGTAGMTSAASITSLADGGALANTGLTSYAGLTASSATVPILFLPDGTADDTSLYVVDDLGRRLRVSVRGLTAAVTVASAEREGGR